MSVLGVSIAVAGLMLTMPVWNLFSTRKLRKNILKKQDGAFVSIIVPMRNEVHNIKYTLPKILDSNYSNCEIILLDDGSSDGTYELCENILGKYIDSFESVESGGVLGAVGGARKNVVLLRGEKLPTGWMGKQWALHQAQKYAKGDLLLFLDADVHLKKNAVSRLVSEFQRKKVDVISVFPRQIMKSFGEKLLVPILHWSLLAFYPIWMAQNSKTDKFCMANGQCILSNRSAYDEIGGHEMIRYEILEDSAFAKNMKKANKRMKIFFCDSFSCRMYSDFSEAFLGFSKNTFTASRVPALLFPGLYLIVVAVHYLGFLAPFINESLLPLTVAIVVLRVIQTYQTGEDYFYNVVLFPVQFTLYWFLGMYSWWKSIFGTVSWKGREYKLK